jgi:hypothetical protein
MSYMGVHGQEVDHPPEACWLLARNGSNFCTRCGAQKPVSELTLDRSLGSLVCQDVGPCKALVLKHQQSEIDS